jgi:hypothetical protein
MDLKAVTLFGPKTDNAGSFARFINGTILGNQWLISACIKLHSTYAEALRGPLYLIALSPLLKSLIVGYEVIPLSSHRPASTVQSMLISGFSVLAAAEIHSGSRALLASLFWTCQWNLVSEGVGIDIRPRLRCRVQC